MIADSTLWATVARIWMSPPVFNGLKNECDSGLIFQISPMI